MFDLQFPAFIYFMYSNKAPSLINTPHFLDGKIELFDVQTFAPVITTLKLIELYFMNYGLEMFYKGAFSYVVNC